MTGSRHPLGTPVGGIGNTGALAAAAWLVAREIFPREPKWFVELTLATGDAPPDERATTRFLVEIYAEEWGFMFVHDNRVSWIRVTDVPFIHGRDEHLLLRRAPRLSHIGNLLANLETTHALRFNRAAPAIRTTLSGGESAIAAWARDL